MFGVGEEEVATTIAAAMLRGGCGGNDVARGNGTMGDDDDDNDGDGSMGDGVTGYDDNDDDDR